MRVSAVCRLLAVGMLASASWACAPTGPSSTTPSSGTKPLAPVEVRQYKGAKLSSVNDFIENSIKGPQTVDRAKYRLRVAGDVASQTVYTYSDVLALKPAYTKVVTLDCVEGWSVTILWEGVKLSDLLDRSGVRSGANTVIFHAVDGYATSLPLDYIRSKDILLAYKMNGIEIPAERGFPFMVVAEDKWGYKWCKWVDRIELSTDANYRGYWEQRGYTNSGDRNKPSIGP
jgi:DMSO/TMAO reductase YedYZ molybdopterin-dependent catalytic subunit